MNSTTISQERILYVTGLGVLQWSIVEFVSITFSWLDMTVLEAEWEKSQLMSSCIPKQ